MGILHQVDLGKCGTHAYVYFLGKKEYGRVPQKIIIKTKSKSNK